MKKTPGAKKHLRMQFASGDVEYEPDTCSFVFYQLPIGGFMCICVFTSKMMLLRMGRGGGGAGQSLSSCRISTSSTAVTREQRRIQRHATQDLRRPQGWQTVRNQREMHLRWTESWMGVRGRWMWWEEDRVGCEKEDVRRGTEIESWMWVRRR